MKDTNSFKMREMVLEAKRFLFLSISFVFVILLFPLLSAQAQKPILVHNQDTTYFIENPMLDNITITAKRIPTLTTLNELINKSELTTSVSGVTKDLQRDLPSMIRIYTPQGIPMLTKYTSNNSLTSTIPDSVIQMEQNEPGAKYPNPDAPVIMRPNYNSQSSLSLSPLHQTMNISFSKDHSLSGSFGLSHSAAPKKLQDLIPEFQVYSTTYSGYGAMRANVLNTTTEIIVHHSQSNNEYGDLLDVEQLLENDEGTSVFINTQLTLGKQTLDVGFARQAGWENRFTKDLNSQIRVINRIKASSYTAALSRNNTAFRVNFHNLQRVYSYSHGDTLEMQRFETLFTHRHEISPSAEFTIETRFDHKDQEPSLSTELLLQAHRNILLSFNAARLYDAVGSEGLNSVMHSMQIDPHPWEVSYLRIGSKFALGSTVINTSITAKKTQLGWYGKSANTEGWIARLGGDGLLYSKSDGYLSVSWYLEGVIRSLSIEIPNRPIQFMPGPARLEGHATLQTGIGKMKYTIRADTFIDRRMRITDRISGNLGSQYFLSIAATRTMDFIQLGAMLSNGLALLGQENKILGHYSESKGIQYIPAPPFINLTLGVNF